MSIGQGAQDLILGQIEGLGSRTAFVEPGREPEGFSGFAEIYANSIGKRELDALERRENVPGLQEAAPAVIAPATIVYGSEVKRTTVLGSTDLYARILDVYPYQGVFFTDDDVGQKARVVVLGSEVKNDLFGDSNAVGEIVKIKNQSFKVIGVIPKTGTVGAFNIDDSVMMPYSAAQQYLLGINYFHQITVRAVSDEAVSEMVSDIRATLRELHDIEDPDDDDFHVTTQEDAAETVGTITTTLTALLGSVAAISLLVGGIGIMNIMLVSVSERTREIGLRKALGATTGNIMTQFLLEAVLLTALGGIIGIILGALFSFGAAVALQKTVASGWSFAFPISAALLGIGVSAFVGLVFGLYPARKAAKKSPIEALRYE
jgi:putative ABC transport system permease protein